MSSIVRTTAIILCVIVFLLSIVFLALAQAGYSTSAVQDELTFRELTQPRIEFIREETLDCINLELRGDNELFQQWLDVDTQDWIMYALMGEEAFPYQVSSVHNADYLGLKLKIAQNCPYEQGMKHEFQYWFKRVYGTPITDWFDYYNPLVIN